ncbi:hypothetical protein ACFSL4_28105 [Streptomyces caeni]|uniref:Peptidase S8/S53 domain-containing protein n=1 Tax=Streptomyces caeni TaxID=2307231 RepID=A0ABW4IZI8_9ACTN
MVPPGAAEEDCVRPSDQIGTSPMCTAGLAAVLLAIPAERRSPEDIVRPLTAAPAPAETAL